MLDDETITQQFTLLAAHRRTLAHLMEQAAQFGGEVFAPPQTANGIAEARAHIARIKAELREGGVQVEDEPNDEAPSQADVPQTGGADPRVQTTVTVQDNKGTVTGVQFNQPNWTVAGNVTNVAGDQRNVNTAGGDYAEGNIDKRQGTFVEGGTVQGPVIADNQGTVNVNYTYQQAVALTPVNYCQGSGALLVMLRDRLGQAAISRFFSRSSLARPNI